MKYQPFEAGHFFHIYNRGNNKEHIFLEQDNYIYFLSLVKKYLVNIGDVYSYCLLPNHFHILFRFKKNEKLPTTIKEGKHKLYQPISNMLNAYTKAINKSNNRRGSLFQEHLKRIKITDENYLKNLIIYINTNPSHHQIANYETYAYSSYLSLISEKTSLLKRKEVIEYFDDKDNFKSVLASRRMDTEGMEDIVLE
jgi:REP element-mobilizing transposase RayT